MAWPLLLPWACTTPQPNPYDLSKQTNVLEPSSLSGPTNTWDYVMALATLENELAEHIKKSFGRDISLSELLELLTGYKQKALTDQQLVDLIEMGIFFAENTLGWEEAPSNLRHWLEGGGTGKTMKHELIIPLVIDDLCGDYYETVKSGIDARLKATPGQLFPPATMSIVGPSGETITVTPAESPLSAGGEDTLYLEKSVHTTRIPTDDLYNAVAAVWLDSTVKVKSEKLSSGGWRVTIVDWKCWFWDDYDWNKKGQAAEFELGLSKLIPATQRDQLKTLGYDPTEWDRIRVDDQTMLQIDDKQVDMGKGRQLHPKAYRIYSDSTWQFDASVSCSKETVFEMH